MDKKLIIIIIAILVVIGLTAGGYFIWSNWKKTKAGIDALEKAGKGAETITDSATKGVLPSINTNPLENKPDINPAGNANPIKNIKTNPFE